MNSALQGEGGAASLWAAAPDGARLFMERRAKLREARPLACHGAIIWSERALTCRKDVLGWDCNQTRIKCEAQPERGDHFLVREGTRDGKPKASTVAHSGSTNGPRR